MKRLNLKRPLIVILYIFVISMFSGNAYTDSTLGVDIEPELIDLAYLDSSLIVNDGYTYSTDSSAVMAILKANGWGMPIVDSMFAYVMDYTVDSISDSLNGRIVKLNLNGILACLQISAFGFHDRPSIPITPIPQEIKCLTALQALDISANKCDTMPHEIGSLINLSYLWCNLNYLNRVPSEIGNLKELKELDLIGNEFTCLPPEIGNLSKLTGFALYDNKKLNQLPPEIGGLISLRYFSCFWTPLKTLPPEIGNLQKLEYLSLDGDSIAYLPNELGRCISLENLLIKSNQLTDMPDSIVNLQYCVVYIDSNYICSPHSLEIHDWLDSHASGRTYWRYTQKCDVLPVPPWPNISIRSQSNINGQNHFENRSVSLYDLRGRRIGPNSTGEKRGLPIVSGV